VVAPAWGKPAFRGSSSRSNSLLALSRTPRVSLGLDGAGGRGNCRVPSEVQLCEF